MVLTPAETSVLLKGYVNNDVVRAATIADLIIRGYIKMGKKWMQQAFFPTEKAKKALKSQLLRPYELKLLSELGKYKTASMFMQDQKGSFSSFSYFKDLDAWAVQEGLIRHEKGILGKVKRTEKGEDLARKPTKASERLREAITEAHARSEEEGKRMTQIYLPWIQLMRIVTPKEQRPPWLKIRKKALKEALLGVLGILALLVSPDFRGALFADWTGTIAADTAAKYLKPDLIIKTMESGQFDENEELEIYYPKAYSV